MSGSSKQQQTTQSAPWGPTQGILQNSFLPAIQSQFGNYQPSSYQTNALNQLQTNASNLPNYAPQAESNTSSLLSGDPYGYLSSGLTSYQNAVNPIASASLDPTQTPGMSNVLSTIQNDVTNSVNGMFAGAGRDGSGLNQQYLARGIAQGEAQPLLNQYNQNVQNVQNAASGLLGAGQTTSNAMVNNQTQGFNMANSLPSLVNQSPLEQLQAAQTANSLPLQQLAQLESLTLPIAGLGSTSSSSGTQTQSPWSQTMQLLSFL
jgi:hypothetical protein